MVSSSHEAMHRIFQKDPGVFSRTFRTLDLPLADPDTVSLMPTDLTEIKPLERRVDTLLRIDTVMDGSYLLAVEAQGRKDPDKPASWAYYLAYLHTKYRLPAVLLVTCQDRGTATWASGPFVFGPDYWPMLTIRPLVLGPHNVPVLTDARTAAKDIALATLSAITHGRDANADAILRIHAAALRTVDEETAEFFAELTELGLGSAPAAKTWRHLMTVDLAFFRSETSERLRAEGRVLGREEGRIQGRAEDILRILERRGIETPDTVRDRVTSCTDIDTLDTWFDRALTATTAEDLFAGTTS
ncbi:hypothetical protein J7E87_15650 [Streptomyces sp. ISL-1]|uniref:hypothetical protein n=1 Tax=Streptomyces sp. ISL-1 TaxID=2817657 RepID=UPI001BEB4A96|nr:hypothetical protein [Streptomyces sp. ISL-1]MBT2390817.1 hypothetical protein [Streptomyces sp. ISL-1]